MTVKTYFLIALFLLVASTVFGTPNTQVKIGYGTSSNPSGSLDGVTGSFAQFLPEWRQPFHNSDSTVLSAALSANLRRYNNEFLASNADYSQYKAELKAESTITPLLTGGISFHAQKVVAHIASPRIDEVYGEQNGFNEFGLGIFGGTTWGNWSWKLETVFLGRDFELTQYEDKENIIFDDHKDFKKVLRLTYDPPGDLKVDLAGQWIDRRYIENSLNPLSKYSPPPRGYPHPLEFVQEDYLLTITPELDDFKAETLVDLGWDVDRTNGATTQKRGRLTQKFEFPFWKERLKLRPLIDVLFRYFPNLQLPLIPVPRSDTVFTAAAELGFKFTKEIEAAVGFYKLGSSSNSLVHNYYEDFFSTELSATF
jgi:hypothetical protein